MSMIVKSPAKLLFLFLAILGFSMQIWAQADDIAVVASSSNPATNVTMPDLKKMFSGVKRGWPGGRPIKLITRGPGCRERLTLLKLLSMSEEEYRQYWTAEVFRGEADAAPLAVPSVGMQKEAIMAFPGGLTLVGLKDVKPGMKVIRVDGLLPGDPGYPLH
jgi:hypothetical protein